MTGIGEKKERKKGRNMEARPLTFGRAAWNEMTRELKERLGGETGYSPRSLTLEGLTMDGRKASDALLGLKLTLRALR